MSRFENYKLGIFSWYGFPLPIYERLRLISEAGFDATTLWWEDEVGFSGGEKEKVPDMVRGLGLILDNIHVPFHGCNDFWSDSADIRKDITRKHIEWLRDCQKYSIPRMVMHLSDGYQPPPPNKYGLDAMKEIVREAEECGVVIALENTMRQDEILSFIFSEIKSQNLGLCYDTSHDWLLAAKKADILKEYGAILASTHISDNDGMADRHWLPQEGIVDWMEVVKVFPKDYQGCITLEVLPREEDLKQQPELFLKKAYERLSGFAALILQGGI